MPVLQPDPHANAPIGIRDLAFDRDQYIAEVQRVVAVREWESDRWRTALLDEYPHPGRYWYPRWVEPDQGSTTDGFLVTLLDDCDRNGVVVALTAAPGTPEQRARFMSCYLMSTPTSDWPVICRIRNGD